MKRIARTVLLIAILCLAVGGLTAAGCAKTYDTGMVQGAVTIGPVFPGPVQPNDNRPVPASVLAARKVVIYDSSGKNVVLTLDITQIDQSASGYYAGQLKAGDYVVDISRGGIDHSGQVPKNITIAAGKTVIVDIDIDTGIR